MFNIEKTIGEITQKIKKPPPGFFLVLGLVIFFSLYAAIYSYTNLKAPLIIELKNGGIVLIVFIALNMLAIAMALAAFLEMREGKKWLEFIPEPRFSHVWVTVSVSCFSAIMIFCTPYPKIMTILYVFYCIADGWGCYIFREAIRDRIAARASSTAIKYKTVAFHGVCKHYIDRPIYKLATLKFIASLICAIGAFELPRPEYSYFLLIAIIITNELFVWTWRIIFLKESSIFRVKNNPAEDIKRQASGLKF
jgi:hypothetical protein